MNAQTLELIKDTLTKAGELGAFTFEAAVKATIANGIARCGVGILIVALAVLGWVWLNRWWSKEKETASEKDCEDISGLIGVGRFLLLVASAIGLGTIFIASQFLMAPEWYAIEKLIGSVR